MKYLRYCLLTISLITAPLASRAAGDDPSAEKADSGSAGSSESTATDTPGTPPTSQEVNDSVASVTEALGIEDEEKLEAVSSLLKSQLGDPVTKEDIANLDAVAEVLKQGDGEAAETLNALLDGEDLDELTLSVSDDGQLSLQMAGMSDDQAILISQDGEMSLKAGEETTYHHFAEATSNLEQDATPADRLASFKSFIEAGENAKASEHNLAVVTGKSPVYRIAGDAETDYTRMREDNSWVRVDSKGNRETYAKVNELGYVEYTDTSNGAREGERRFIVNGEDGDRYLVWAKGVDTEDPSFKITHVIAQGEKQWSPLGQKQSFDSISDVRMNIAQNPGQKNSPTVTLNLSFAREDSDNAVAGTVTAVGSRGSGTSSKITWTSTSQTTSSEDGSEEEEEPSVSEEDYFAGTFFAFEKNRAKALTGVPGSPDCSTGTCELRSSGASLLRTFTPGCATCNQR